MAWLSLVVGDKTVPTTFDADIKALLESDGHTVTYVSDDDSVLAGIDCHVILESVSPGILTTKYTSITDPVVSMEVGGWDDLNMTNVNGTNLLSGTSWEISSHPITNGISTGTQNVKTTSQGRFGVPAANLGAGVQSFAAADPTNPTHIVGYAYDTGAAMTTGNATARRVALGMVDSWGTTLNSTGDTIVLQAVEWALGRKDKQHPVCSQYTSFF